MKFFTFFLLSFISFNSASQAGLKSSFDSFQSGEKMSTRESMTGRQSGWGLLNEKPSEIDLSEWGGKPPSCDIAPNCPVCIN